MKRILFLLIAAFLLTAVFPAFAQASSGIVVTANVKNANPTLIFTGGTSDQALNEKILSDLQFCDWFNVLKSGSATYQVSVKGSLQDFTVTVMNSAGVPVFQPFRVSDSKEVDAAAHTAVKSSLDAIGRLIIGWVTQRSFLSVTSTPFALCATADKNAAS